MREQPFSRHFSHLFLSFSFLKQHHEVLYHAEYYATTPKNSNTKHRLRRDIFMSAASVMRSAESGLRGDGFITRTFRGVNFEGALELWRH